jgi:polar amino acid transport system substrate-binding protein
VIGCAADPPPAGQGDAAAISHLTSIYQRGKLTLLCFPVQDSPSASVKLDALRDTGLTLVELRDPDAFTGSDVEMIRALAADLGVALEIEPLTSSYEGLIDAIAQGRGDVAASSLSITRERLKKVDFSDPISSVWAVVAVPLDSSISSLTELADKRGVAMRGSSQREIFQRLVPDQELEE